eukprot:3875751-Rhodomonas_salina.1
MAADLRDCSAHLSDICLDKGRRPYARVGGQHRFLGGEECSVQASEIASIVDRHARRVRLGQQGRPGTAAAPRERDAEPRWGGHRADDAGGATHERECRHDRRRAA